MHIFNQQGIQKSFSLVFCCYHQVDDIFSMSCLGMILQVRGREVK